MSREGLLLHCEELLAPLGPVRSRSMFGGYGLYVDDIFLALIAFDRLYLKVDDATRERFIAAGCEPFSYEMRSGRTAELGYMTAPEEAMESPVLMRPWARLALEAALRARQAAAKRPKPGKAARPPQTPKNSRTAKAAAPRPKGAKAATAPVKAKRTGAASAGKPATPGAKAASRPQQAGAGAGAKAIGQASAKSAASRRRSGGSSRG